VAPVVEGLVAAAVAQDSAVVGLEAAAGVALAGSVAAVVAEMVEVG
jgi:hypothetical protein